MNPEILKQIMQQGGGQPQPGGQPGGAPGNFDPNTNPFEAIMAGMKQPGGQPDPTAGGAPQPGAQPGGIPPGTTMTGGQPQVPDSQLAQGKNPSATKSLVQAVNALQAYVAASTNPDDIALGRNLIKLITRLITKAEDQQLGNLQQGF